MSLLNSLFGGSGGSKHASRTARAIGKKAATKGSELFKEARPVFGGLGDIFSNYLSGNFDVTSSPVWDAGLNQANQAYNTAQQNLLSNMPSGGALMQGLADTERAKANTLTNLASNISQDMFSGAQNYGLNMAQLGLGGLTGSLGSLSNLAGTEAAANAQQQSAKLGKGGDLGLGLGMLAGEGAFKNLFNKAGNPISTLSAGASLGMG